MTTRLLTRSGHAPRAQRVLDALISATLRPALTIDDTVVSAGELPLFRYPEPGSGTGLHQVVRVHVSRDLPALDRVELREQDGSGFATMAPSPPSSVIDLLVPEVTAPSRWRLVVVADGHEHIGEIELAPSRKLTVHLVQHSHLDIGYTDPQGIVLRNHLEYLDAAVELARQGDDTQPDSRFKWTVESNFPIRAWLAHRSSAVIEEFCRLARQDVLEVAAMPFNLHTEASSQEELVRLLRGTFELRERYRIPIRTAMHTDVPGATTGWVDALVEAGVRYLSAAHNWAGRSVPYRTGGQELSRPFWWCTPAGNRMLTWFTDSAHGAAYMEGNLVGLVDSYDEAIHRLPMYLQALTTKPIPYAKDVLGFAGYPQESELVKEPFPYDLLQLRVQGSHSDNACPSDITAEIAQAWNAQWAYPRLVVATNHSFLSTAERELGDRLAEQTGDWGDWWADGLGSGARPLGYNRRAQSILRAAETAHAFADLAVGETHDVREEIDRTYDKIGLFDEHTWGAANPWHDHEHGPGSGAIQWSRKVEFAYQAHDDAQDLLHAAVRRLGAATTAPASAQVLGSVVVYNTSGWHRTDIVDVFVPESAFSASVEDFAVIDSRKAEPVPARITRETRQASPRGWHVQFVATDVPSAGWVRYDITRPTAGSAITPETGSWQLSNEFYDVTYDPDLGAIASITDRATGRELVDVGALTGVNQYIHDAYGSAPGVNHLSSRLHAHDLSLLTSRTVARGTRLVRSERSELGHVLEVETYAPGVDHIRTSVALYRGVPRVEITNRVSKQASKGKESGFFAFPLASSTWPTYELTGSVAGHGIPHVPGAPQHMHAIRHWAAFSEDGYSTAWATMEAPLVQLGTIHLPYAPFPSTIRDTEPEPGTIYSWAFNNIWDTNFPSQQSGEMTFRYAIAGSASSTPQRLGATTATGLTDSLVAVLATGRTGGEPVSGTGSLLSIESPHVLVTSIGRPQDGSPGITVRLRSVALEPTEAVVALNEYPAQRAAVATLFEDEWQPIPVRDGRVHVVLPAGASRTLRLGTT
ncbi:glycoside hydrolase family 38 C-terminal domain-containing protein [Jiangella asiatica]|uniref:Glycoside hydrolase family 38 N-terminal domain-containing protein n=1 Tax=Jiangella asiatica TaxID=2530372 RepID=A0A4V6PFS3_9ACTN|nr:glycoside hydrolase family 38 C-terminal domain-containing protein [Jiangella asiatica]TDE14308.1 hypothetical protein E1269_03900 [Jiangella asiatica]